MPTYIGLYKLTDQGIKDIKNAPQRLEQGIKSLEKLGGKLLSFYTCMGEYDYVGIAECPNDEAAMLFLLGLNSIGNVRTTTMRAFTPQETANMIKKLP
jgi:uncharacterized protein with GYD domain